MYEIVRCSKSLGIPTRNRIAACAKSPGIPTRSGLDDEEEVDDRWSDRRTFKGLAAVEAPPAPEPSSGRLKRSSDAALESEEEFDFEAPASPAAAAAPTAGGSKAGLSTGNCVRDDAHCHCRDARRIWQWL